MDNYFLISFKVALAVAALNLKIPEFYESVKKKFNKWRSRKNVGDKRRQSVTSNKTAEDSDEC